MLVTLIGLKVNQCYSCMYFINFHVKHTHCIQVLRNFFGKSILPFLGDLRRNNSKK